MKRLLQAKIHEWHERNYPGDDAKDALLAVGEELGELMRCQVKQASGIRGDSQNWQGEKYKEVGDVLIGLINYCAWNGIDWEQALKDRWKTISKRDFVDNPQTGNREQEECKVAVGRAGKAADNTKICHTKNGWLYYDKYGKDYGPWKTKKQAAILGAEHAAQEEKLLRESVCKCCGR